MAGSSTSAADRVRTGASAPMGISALNGVHELPLHIDVRTVLVGTTTLQPALGGDPDTEPDPGAGGVGAGSTHGSAGCCSCGVSSNT